LSEAGASPLVVVVAPGDEDLARDVLAGLPNLVLAQGGATRTASVRAGLAMVGDVDAVLIHDAARPFLRAGHIEALLSALTAADGALPALAVADTLKRRSGLALETVSRDSLWSAQTPQAFRLAPLLAAYAALGQTAEATDDAGVVEAAGGDVVLAPGDPLLFKITTPEDLIMAETIAAAAKTTRVGQGVDAHRFGPGDGVWLCGVKIPHDQTLIGHSDADAGLHALTDAILGAIGEGDIGQHFPPTDPKWKGAASSLFLKHAADLAAARGGRIVHLDITLICERPKIGPHRQAMRETLSALLGLPLANISVKATTTEGMGFTGRGEGLVAQAIATIEI